MNERKPKGETETKPEIHATFIMPGTGDLMKDAALIHAMQAEIEALGAKFTAQHGTYEVKPYRRQVAKAATVPVVPLPARGHHGQAAE